MRFALSQLRWERAGSFAYGKTAAWFPIKSRDLADGVAAAEVGSYPAISPLPITGRYTFCCAFCPQRMLEPGNYPASCPAEPGLSSRQLSRRIIAQRRSGSSLFFKINIDDFFFFLIVFLHLLLFYFIRIIQSARIFGIKEYLFILGRFFII